MIKKAIQGILRLAIIIRKEALHRMPLLMGTGPNTNTDIIQTVQFIMTMDGKYTSYNFV